MPQKKTKNDENRPHKIRQETKSKENLRRSLCCKTRKQELRKSNFVDVHTRRRRSNRVFETAAEEEESAAFADQEETSVEETIVLNKK